MQSRLAWMVAFLCQAVAAQDVSLRTVQQSGSLIKYDAEAGTRGPGLCLEVLHAVERVDPGLHFTGLEQQVPLKRVERLLSEGQVDVFFCLLKSPEREKQWRYAPVPLYTIRHVIVQRADDPRQFGSLDDVAAASRQKPVLVMRGTVLSRHLARVGAVVTEVASEREALTMLALGRTDIVYGQDINLQRQVADAGLGGKLKLGGTAFQEEAQFLALRIGLPAVVEDRLTQALRKLEKDGMLRQLYDKYR